MDRSMQRPVIGEDGCLEIEEDLSEGPIFDRTNPSLWPSLSGGVSATSSPDLTWLLRSRYTDILLFYPSLFVVERGHIPFSAVTTINKCRRSINLFLHQRRRNRPS